MPGAVIGKAMNYGWAGKITRDADMIIESRIVGADSDDIKFGDPVYLDTDNTVRKVETTDTTIVAFAGVAVAGIRQTIDYATQEAYFTPKTQADVLVRGSILVALPATYETAPTAGGKVYLDPATGKFTPDADDGATPTATNFIEVTNAKFTTGLVDANKMAEITLLSRNAL